MFRDLDWTHVLILVAAVAVVVYATGTGVETDSTSDGTMEDTVAEVRLSGSIMPDSMLSSEGVSPGAVREVVEEAESDGVEAYLFVINSGGGSVVASKDLTRVIEDIEEPTACLMKDAAASGAYWAATACDRIVADELTMTGSIGVRSTYLEFSGLLEKLGIEYVNLTAGELKDAGSPLKNITDEEREMLQDQLDVVHDAFIEQVAESRDLDREHVEEYATGEPLLGQQAHEAALVDVLGGQDEAMTYLENATGTNLTTSTYRQRPSLSILSMLTMKLGEGIGTAVSGEVSSAIIDDRLLAE